MKLLFCDSCGDMFSLGLELKTCSCGKVKGKYLDDNLHAVVNGQGHSVAIGNGSLITAIIKASIAASNTERDMFIEDANVTHCWVRPHEGPGNPHTVVDPTLGAESHEPGPVDHDEMLKVLKHFMPFIESEEDDHRQAPWVARARKIINSAKGAE